MATDIKISELNEITSNNDINHIIINDRENPGDEGITKKIKLENFLTPNIVQEPRLIEKMMHHIHARNCMTTCRVCKSSICLSGLISWFMTASHIFTTDFCISFS